MNDAVLTNTIQRCREKHILIPTVSQMMNPSLIPGKVTEHLSSIGLWDVNPLNLFRITWKNEPIVHGGKFNHGNWVEFPSELTGVRARIVGLTGKYFPTGSHKVGAAFGCLVPRLVSGEFDPTVNTAVWPSTGNFCRGGAFDSALLGCSSIAILPEGMSRERFDWLRKIGSEVIATPGCESNVKEIYDKCWEIRRTRPECVIFNQFAEFGNSIWHYHVTGSAIKEIYESHFPQHRLAAFVSATGSAGTVAAADHLSQYNPEMKTVVAEALQCPTLYQFGFGDHRIEGIGDKHVPWIHNIQNTDLVCAIDDEMCVSLFRLFNEQSGHECLARLLDDSLISQLPLLGISSICNLIASIKVARHYKLDEKDIIFTCLTDSSELYTSRLDEYNEQRGRYTSNQAQSDYEQYLSNIDTKYMRELSLFDRKALHNFKYFTWVEQQGKTVDELSALWSSDFWENMYSSVDKWDEMITHFNSQTRVLETL